jgi:hypothetical protein
MPLVYSEGVFFTKPQIEIEIRQVCGGVLVKCVPSPQNRYFEAMDDFSNFLESERGELVPLWEDENYEEGCFFYSYIPKDLDSGFDSDEILYEIASRCRTAFSSSQWVLALEVGKLPFAT